MTVAVGHVGALGVSKVGSSMRLPVLATVEVETSSRDDGADGYGGSWVRGCRACEGSMCALSEACTLRTDVASVCPSSNSAVAGVCKYMILRCGEMRICQCQLKVWEMGVPGAPPLCAAAAISGEHLLEGCSGRGDHTSTVTQAGADGCGEPHARV